MKLNAKFAYLAIAALVIGAQFPIASNANQPTLPSGDYIVVFDNQANEQAEAAKLRGQGANIRFTYSSVFKGLAGTFNSAQISALQKNPRVQSIEADTVVSIDATQTGATWGLDRVDQRNRPLNGSYIYSSTGAGVKAYVVDTGILAGHVEFTGRMAPGSDFINDGNGTTDCNGHGTHVAGTIAGTTYGVAKGATLVPVRVLGCSGSGSLSGVVAGLNWIASNNSGPAVANMSLGASKSTTVNSAVSALVAKGVTVVVAAGNSNRDACQFSPASELSAITVGATTSSDSRASYSNFGTCLDVFAPGSSITSAWYTSNSSTSTISGTSMASPHVAGVAALYLQTNTTALPSVVAQAIIGNSTKNVVSSAGKGSPNRLLFTNY